MRHARGREEERVLLLPATAADVALCQSILREADLAFDVCSRVDELPHELAAGAGAILLTDQVLAAIDASTLALILQRQPSWSDIPVLLLSASGADSSVAAWATELLGNVTVLERPVRVTNLVSALRTAIRARHRQYELRSQLEELAQAESTLRKQSERLRLLWEAASVLLTTEEPDVMMQALFAKIAPHFGLDAYFNYIVSDTGDSLQLESYAGISSLDAGPIMRLLPGQGVSGSVAQRRHNVVYSNMQTSDDPTIEFERRFGIRAYSCSPLIAEGRLLGTLCYGTRRRDSFSTDEIEFLRTICRYVTVAYDRLRLIRELRETDRRKDEFLATLAHELRNPLAPIRNALQIMELTRGDETSEEHARAMMERQLAQMVRLIDDLLDVSRITRGKLDLRCERVELSTILNNAVDTARPLIQSFGHVLHVVSTGETVLLDADAVRLAQVFSNLLNNAAKYMDRGGQIWLTARRDGPDVVVSVRDTGTGIPHASLHSIFEMFTQVNRSLERSQGGLGIGLTLVKRLVELHGGSVEARSEGVGKGAEFIVRLPVLTTFSDQPLADANSARQPNETPRRILVADDNRDAADSMGMMLRLMGNEVRTANDGVQAVEAAAEFHPDLILLDIGMPRLNGYDAARQIRKQDWSHDTVLVALTGWGQEEDRRHAFDAGFDRHFTKPVSPVELERLVAGLSGSPAKPTQAD